MECEFSNPVNYLLDFPANSSEAWQFQSMDCNVDYRELIENINTGKSFYIEKTINYGEQIIIVFLTIFLVFGAFKIIWNYFHGKKL